ncbi:phosphate ABC transporter substrate-binding protein PstS [Rothia sp. AR01]|uniref:Phosphate-binding protein n=1 Tax=Rothia santali TaxID=2949643 RepID=A0A9X2HEB7_9MICC|nr:phosphate ABC transporter substrate-binding protein PstS [Rothia santali]MCP3426147.1 phosphate ABC transporter substrate-binding protein PstS [Rothia santali]
MKLSRIGRFAALAAVGTLALTACGTDDATGQGTGTAGGGDSVTGTVSGVGASSQQAAMTAWQTGFQEVNSGASVQYSPDGSGAGREAFLAGGADFAGSDAHLDDDETESSREVCGPDGAINIPAYVSPIAVAFNLPGVEHVNMDGPTIAKVFKGEITRWNDPAIAAENEGVELPDTAITVVHRSDDSGTTENFTEYLAAASDGAWGQEPDGNWPGGYSAEANKGTSGVVSTTAETEGAITYADDSAVGDLGTVNVQSGEQYVEVSQEAAAAALESAQRVEGRGEHDMSLELNRTPDDGSYPIVLVSYHVVCSQYQDQEVADRVKAFEGYVVSEDGQQTASDAAGSAPLSEGIRQDAQRAVDSITAGG